MLTPARSRSLPALFVAAVLVLTSCSTSGGSESSATTAESAPTSTQPTTTTEAEEAEPAPTIPADRPVEVHVPASYSEDTPAPLLVLLHGFGANGAAQEAYLGLTKPAEEAGMLYVYPDGTKNLIDKQFWNATDACCAGPISDIDDSAYLRTVIDSVSAEYNVDPKRIFLVGHSNGGFMSYRMACDHADVVAALVSLEGATFDDPERCEPSEPVSILQVHGKSDTTIFYDGSKIIDRAYPGAEQTVETWATYNGCSLTADDPAPPSRQIIKDLPPAEVFSYSTGCEPGGHAELWSQPEGTHIPPWTVDFPQQLIDWLLDHPKP